MYIVPIWEWMGLKKKRPQIQSDFFSEKKISILVYTICTYRYFQHELLHTRKIILSNILMAVIVLSILLHGVEKTQKLG